MQPPAPPVYRRTALTRLPLARCVDQATRITLRQIGRFPLRSLMTSSGIALAVGLLVMAIQWNDAIEAIAESYFYEGQHQTMTVGLAEAQSSTVVEDLKHLPGVLAAEELRIVGANLSVGTRRHRGALTGVPHGAHLQPIHDDALHENVEIPDSGVVLGTELAEKLGVGVGDEVWVDVLEGRRPSSSIRVAGTIETQIALPAYMEIGALNRLLEVRPTVEYVNLLVDRNAEPALFAELKGLPKVSAIMLREAAIDSFYSTMAEHLLIYIGIFTTFAAALAFGVAYNSARIALSERGRELATLRVLGFTRGEVSYVLLGELAVLVLLALPLGCWAGWALSSIMSQAFETELYRVPLLIRPSTYGYAVLIAVSAVAVSAAIVRRRVDRLDMIRVLKTRE
jgi:putative ABC transport system permease protein